MWLVAGVGVGLLIWFDPVGKARRAQIDAGSGSGSTVVVATPDAAPAPMVIDAGAPGAIDAPLVVEVEIDAPPPAPLYTPTEALDDLAAAPLELVGTGPWFGNYSIHACAYRNARVMVVNVYCTKAETPALGLAVISPTRGRVYIYAEAEAAISTLQRDKYFTFRVEAQPPFEDVPISLGLTYPELNAWEDRRYHAHLGDACWHENGGEAGCGSGIELQAAWSDAAKAFVAEPPASWYRLTKDLHARAVRDLRASKRR